MISPALWREVFLPRYAEQFAGIHRAWKRVWFHTCGNVWAIIGDKTDIGVDILELLKPDVCGVERLAAEFGGKVCFCCSVDHQRCAQLHVDSRCLETTPDVRVTFGIPPLLGFIMVIMLLLQTHSTAFDQIELHLSAVFLVVNEK